MKSKLVISLWLVLSLLNSSCIHTQSHEYKEIKNPNASTPPLMTKQFGDLQLRSVVYVPSKFPLSNFFTRLKKGEFTDAFKRLDLNYKQSNVNDEALAQIIDHGFIPAYVEVQNLGKESVILDEKNFFLSNGKNQIKGFYSEHLPKEFKEFSPAAVGANVINTGVVIVGFVAILAAFVVVASSSSSGNPDFSFLGKDKDQVNTNDGVYNDINTTTKVDYKNLLLTKTEIKPGETMRGLLFFNFENYIDIHEHELFLSALPSLSN